MSGTDLLFVQGIQKTGSSSLLGMLNSHPEVFLLYEVDLARVQVSRYGQQLLARYPDARQFFRREADVGVPYAAFFDYLASGQPPHRYRYAGAKLLSLDVDRLQRVTPHRVVFAVRDVRSWLCKSSIAKNYRTDLDVVPVAIDYARYVLGSFASPNSVRIRLEDLVLRNPLVVDALSAFLELDLGATATHWWENVERHGAEDPKSAIPWARAHQSSRVPPTRLDTSFELAPHPFWDELLPLFDRYYTRDGAAGVARDQVEADLSRLELLRRYSPLPLSRAYARFETARIRADRGGGVARMLRRLAGRWQSA